MKILLAVSNALPQQFTESTSWTAHGVISEKLKGGLIHGKRNTQETLIKRLGQIWLRIFERGNYRQKKRQELRWVIKSTFETTKADFRVKDKGLTSGLI